MARRLGVSRDAVAKYADMEGMSPDAPLVPRGAPPLINLLNSW